MSQDARLSTPVQTPRQAGTPPSPSLKTDGIALDRPHLGRERVVQEIFETALEKQFVVLKSPAATGKTSLLQLLEQALKVRGAKKKARMSSHPISYR